MEVEKSDGRRHGGGSAQFFLCFFYSKFFYINSPWVNAKSKVHAQQFGNLRRTAQIKSGKQEYKVLE